MRGLALMHEVINTHKQIFAEFHLLAKQKEEHRESAAKAAGEAGSSG